MSAWPKVATQPAADEVVSVLMTEEMARNFEKRCLGDNTRARTKLSPPLRFGPEDFPTYIIHIDDQEAEGGQDQSGADRRGSDQPGSTG